MPYNRFGDLYKSEVVERLKEMGCNVKNVHALNLILEKMGLQEHIGKDWLPTEEGRKHTIYKSRVYNADGWHPSIVDAVYKFLKEERKD